MVSLFRTDQNQLSEEERQKRRQKLVTQTETNNKRI